jgi:predicted RNA methylase
MWLRRRRADQPPVDPARQWFNEHYYNAVDDLVAFLAADGVTLDGKEVADVGAGDGIIDLGLAQRTNLKRLVAYDPVPVDQEHLKREAAIDTLPLKLHFRAVR